MDVIQYSMQKPLWMCKLFLVYLGHPILFLGFLFLFGGLRSAENYAFTKISTNVHRINLGLYLALTLPVFLAWIVIQVELFNFLPGFRVEYFLAYQTSVFSLFFAIPGLMNLRAFACEGIEGDSFGFLVLLPMLFACVGYVILWVGSFLLSFADEQSHYLRGSA